MRIPTESAGFLNVLGSHTETSVKRHLIYFFWTAAGVQREGGGGGEGRARPPGPAALAGLSAAAGDGDDAHEELALDAGWAKRWAGMRHWLL